PCYARIGQRLMAKRRLKAAVLSASHFCHTNHCERARFRQIEEYLASRAAPTTQTERETRPSSQATRSTYRKARLSIPTDRATRVLGGESDAGESKTNPVTGRNGPNETSEVANENTPDGTCGRDAWRNSSCLLQF